MRRVASHLVVAVLSLVLCAPALAHAVSESALKARLEDLKGQTAQAGREYESAFWALDETEVRLVRTDKRIARARKDLTSARKRLGKRVGAMYRREDLDSLAFLLGSRSFEDLATRMDYLERLGAADADAVAEVKALRSKLLAERTKLRRDRARRAKDVAALRQQRDKLQASLSAKQTEFRRLKAQLDASRAGGSLPGGVSAMPGPNGMVFPVLGSYYYADTWGASRSGGRRRHQGTDIMASRGTPCVAVLSGRVQAKTNGLGGKTIWLTADNGWSFYYAHLDTWVVSSGRVKAGQVIGTVGSTGNAAASSPHLHFQIHPGGGAAVNPYPYLRQME